MQRSPCRDSGRAIRPVPTPISSNRVCGVAATARAIPAAMSASAAAGIDRVAS